MNPLSRRYAAAFFALLLAGCGGSGGDNDEDTNEPEQPTAHALAGAYSGTHSSDLADSGAVQVTISNTGTVNGAITSLSNQSPSKSFTFSGTITEEGVYRYSASRYGNPAENLTGTWTRDVIGRLGGTLVVTGVNGAETYTFSLRRTGNP